MDLATPLTSVKGIGPARAAMLEAKGLATVEDLLGYVPFRYEDRSNMKPIAQLAPGEMATVLLVMFDPSYDRVVMSCAGHPGPVLATVLSAAFMSLLVVFRSVVIAVKAAAMNLLSVCAAYGVLTAVTQWGWLGHALGLSHARDPQSIMCCVSRGDVGNDITWAVYKRGVQAPDVRSVREQLAEHYARFWRRQK